MPESVGSVSFSDGKKRVECGGLTSQTTSDPNTLRQRQAGFLGGGTDRTSTLWHLPRTDCYSVWFEGTLQNSTELLTVNFSQYCDLYPLLRPLPPAVTFTPCHATLWARSVFRTDTSSPFSQPLSDITSKQRLYLRNTPGSNLDTSLHSYYKYI